MSGLHLRSSSRSHHRLVCPLQPLQPGYADGVGGAGGSADGRVSQRASLERGEPPAPAVVPGPRRVRGPLHGARYTAPHRRRRRRRNSGDALFIPRPDGRLQPLPPSPLPHHCRTTTTTTTAATATVTAATATAASAAAGARNQC